MKSEIIVIALMVGLVTAMYLTVSPNGFIY